MSGFLTLSPEAFNLLSLETSCGTIPFSPRYAPKAWFSTSYPSAEIRPHTSAATDSQEQCCSSPYLSPAPSAKHTFSHSPKLVYTSGFREFQRKLADTPALQRIKTTKPIHYHNRYTNPDKTMKDLPVSIHFCR